VEPIAVTSREQAEILVGLGFEHTAFPPRQAIEPRPPRGLVAFEPVEELGPDRVLDRLDPSIFALAAYRQADSHVPDRHDRHEEPDQYPPE
jgi:hypothetical protein